LIFHGHEQAAACDNHPKCQGFSGKLASSMHEAVLLALVLLLACALSSGGA